MASSASSASLARKDTEKFTVSSMVPAKVLGEGGVAKILLVAATDDTAVVEEVEELVIKSLESLNVVVKISSCDESNSDSSEYPVRTTDELNTPVVPTN